MSDRRFVFLNHATPEDNSFTAWLGARLAAAGYAVWSDLLMLGGGETFWNDINEGIRRRSALFIPILSPAAAPPDKRGVHNEIAMAMQVQRREKRDTFILPVLLEQVPEPNPEIIQLNYIDFSRGWAAGLARLLERMAKLGVPRDDGPDSEAMQRWLRVQGHLAGAVRDTPSVLTSNWLPITALPPTVRYLGTPASRQSWDDALKTCRVPLRPHLRMAVTFAEASEVQMEVGPSIPVRVEYEMPTQAFLEGRPPKNMPQLMGVDARRMAVDMLRQGWEALAASRGLRPHDMADKRCWFVPEGLLPGDWGTYGDGAGGKGRRKLVGIRGKRKVRYHFAVSAKPQVLPFPRLILRSHVVFSEGGVLVTERRTAQRNRKALCKNWWNPEWRDRQRAMLSLLCGGTLDFRLPLGGTVAIVSATPLAFESAFSFITHTDQAQADEAEEVDDFDETLAEVDPDGDEDDEDES